MIKSLVYKEAVKQYCESIGRKNKKYVLANANDNGRMSYTSSDTIIINRNLDNILLTTPNRVKDIKAKLLCDCIANTEETNIQYNKIVCGRLGIEKTDENIENVSTAFNKLDDLPFLRINTIIELLENNFDNCIKLDYKDKMNILILYAYYDKGILNAIFSGKENITKFYSIIQLYYIKDANETKFIYRNRKMTRTNKKFVKKYLGNKDEFIELKETTMNYYDMFSYLCELLKNDKEIARLQERDNIIFKNFMKFNNLIKS